MTIRNIVLKTHRWIGLATSLVLAIAGVTGAILVWVEASLLRRVSSRAHQTLVLGAIGERIVVAATWLALLLILGGLMLWWKSKRVTLRRGVSWYRTLADLHHVVGVLFLVPMMAIVISGVAMRVVSPKAQPALRRVVMDLHTAGGYPMPIKVVYTIASATFAMQGATGIVMWWRTSPRRGAPKDGRE